MRRRAFVAGSIAVLATARGVTAQPAGKPIRIGRLSPLTAASEAPFMEAFRRGMTELGWVEGRDFTIEARYAEGRIERLPQLAASLVQERVDVILTGSNPGALAARNASSTLPVVIVTTGDPIGGGIVASLARPGGNVTGVTALGQVLNAKRLEVLKEAIPGLKRAVVLVNPASPYTKPFLADRERMARELGVELPVVEARAPGDLGPSFAAIARERAGAIMVVTDPMFITHRRTIIELAARHRLPAVYGERESVDAGGLMFYGASLVDMYRRAASYVDRIVKGARPSDLPIEQPTKFELVVNLKTARSLGLIVPQSLLLRADQVIE
jgi:putative ABC transport system substrate-binding protein